MNDISDYLLNNGNFLQDNEWFIVFLAASLIDFSVQRSLDFENGWRILSIQINTF